MPNLKLKIGCTAQELERAQRLRFEVFDLEMNKNPGFKPPASGLDKDEFDGICEHIIVIDEDKGLVVGTYRMLLRSVADRHQGFYSETKFNIDAIKKLPGEQLEVGRSCVHKDYRDNQVLNLLWQGIVQYTIAHQAKYIFGCANILTADLREIQEYCSMFKTLGLLGEMHVTPRHPAHAISIDGLEVPNPKEIYQKLPTLFKGYMNIGLKVCGLPVKGDFGTAVFFVVLDIQNMNKSYKRRFFGDYLATICFLFISFLDPCASLNPSWFL